MDYTVLIKQVPAEPSVAMNADFTLDRRRVRKITNPADIVALKTAVEWRAKTGGSIRCITMGPKSAEDCLREAAMAGADELIHICDGAYAGADTLVTANALAAAIRLTGSADVVLCGRSSVDGETGQVGAELAALLDFPCVTPALSVDEISNEEIRCVLLKDSGTARCLLRPPAVICLCASKSTEILPTLSAMRRACSMPVRVLTAAELGFEGRCAKDASPTRVIRAYPKQRSRRKVQFLDATDVTRVASLIGDALKKEDTEA